MTDGKSSDFSKTIASQPADGRVLSPAARRALAEADERRRRMADQDQAKEIGGRGGLEPVRYGDWEVKGLTSDF